MVRQFSHQTVKRAYWAPALNNTACLYEYSYPLFHAGDRHSLRKYVRQYVQESVHILYSGIANTEQWKIINKFLNNTTNEI